MSVLEPEIDRLGCLVGGGQTDKRPELITAALPYVRLLVGRMGLHLPPSLSMEDAVSYGALGLIEAVEKFRPDRGISFTAFLAQHVRWAVLDGLREMDYLPRSVRKRARETELAAEALSQHLLRSPTQQELAEFLHIDEDQTEERLKEVNYSLLSLDDQRYGSEGYDSLLDLIPDEASVAPDSGLADEAETEELASVISALPEQQRLVLDLYYYQSLTLKEIGHVLGVSESRVCQIHAMALMRLREAYRKIDV
jgi:RNA polymerase sigma factor for flagellar operon FliA